MTAPAESSRAHPLHAWLQTTRPKTLFAALAPVLMAGSMAWGAGPVHVPVFLATLMIAVLIQIGTNFCNDVFDHHQGADTEKRQGPRRGLHSGTISLQQLTAAVWVCFGGVAILSGLLVMRGGWPIVWLAAASIFCGVFYTAGRYSLAYTGLADVFVVMFFGPIAMCGTYYLQFPERGWPPPEVWIGGVAPGLIATGLLAVNNLRDVDEDRESRKLTLAVRFGRSFSRWEYTFCLLGALAVPIGLVVVTGRGTATLLVWMLIPLMWKARKRVMRGTTGQDLNPALGLTGKLLLLYAVVFSLTWPIG
jgi:1,4-dihydroxy-2-naphthoate octaprenyltransferase